MELRLLTFSITSLIYKLFLHSYFTLYFWSRQFPRPTLLDNWLRQCLTRHEQTVNSLWHLTFIYSLTLTSILLIVLDSTISTFTSMLTLVTIMAQLDDFSLVCLGNHRVESLIFVEQLLDLALFIVWLINWVEVEKLWLCEMLFGYLFCFDFSRVTRAMVVV